MPSVCVRTCRGKPLAEADQARTGREWRHPSPTTAIKAAALRTVCQALVPDSSARAHVTGVGIWLCVWSVPEWVG